MLFQCVHSRGLDFQNRSACPGCRGMEIAAWPSQQVKCMKIQVRTALGSMSFLPHQLWRCQPSPGGSAGMIWACILQLSCCFLQVPSQNCSPLCPGSPGAFPLVTGLNFRPPGDPVTQALFFYLLHFPPQGWGLMVTKDTRCPSVVATRWQNALCAWKGRVEPPENRDGLSLLLPSAASIIVIFL